MAARATTQKDCPNFSLNEPTELWRNESAREQHWLAIKLVGVKSNRDDIGARIKLVTADGKTQFNHVTTSVGYASSSDARVQFGLGKEKTVKLIEIRWPSGVLQALRNLRADRTLTIKEESSRAVR